ncbi:transporter substrate-binding domain-containing protein [Hoeflea alexandrii]|uniref:Transporter substrate-binding domain-containing protein n=1 Tax=Hoeflea alexandrii TaxID=288436 RepID=A0ABT1CWT6_9HYPH|nr:transporter substrate-binding domain-containing protein [Hoeflea alexandrii]MCO6410408.1 transporter substrate-binding domain-containing protein [Hoeflea alexandrii]MCY0152422.1 transporter substrate-binding domain-containing protein [Hoeflea alexandrii]
MKNKIITTIAALGLSLAASAASAETVRVGVAAEPYPPFTEPDAAGNWTGWEIEFMNAVCAEAKLDCVVTPVAWDGIIPALTSNKIDAIIGSMSITEERMKTIDFSDKYYNTPSVIATSKGSGITPDAAGLKDKIIGVQVSTIHQDYVTTHFGDVAAEVKEYQTQDEANQDLAAGRVDAIMADSLALDAFVKSDACCEIVGAVEDDPAILGAGVGVGLRKGDDALREKFNTAIAAIRENGTYAEFSKAYFDFDIYGK